LDASSDQGGLCINEWQRVFPLLNEAMAVFDEVFIDESTNIMGARIN
jgi:hypothetical protein